MNDILERYKQIETKAQNTDANLELCNIDGRIVLRKGLRREKRDCLLFIAFPIGFTLVVLHAKSILLSVALTACAAVTIITIILIRLDKRKYPDGHIYCEIYPERQEIRIPERPYQHGYSLLLQDVNCFVGTVWNPRYTRNLPRHRLYAVSQDGKMYQIADPTQNPEDDLAERVCGYLGFVCDKPVYLAEEKIPSEKFITKQSNELVFNFDAFLQAKKDFHPPDAN